MIHLSPPVLQRADADKGFYHPPGAGSPASVSYTHLDVYKRQVSMGRHWFVCRRNETAALKIKAAVSNGRVKLSALRRLFFLCRRPAECYSIFNSMLPVKLSHSIPI